MSMICLKLVYKDRQEAMVIDVLEMWEEVWEVWYIAKIRIRSIKTEVLEGGVKMCTFVLPPTCLGR